MHSSSSSLKLTTSGQSEPLTRLACIRQCQETVQELVGKPAEICVWLSQLARPIAHLSNPSHQQQQAQNLADKRTRFEGTLNDITTQFISLRHLFSRLREIHEYVINREPTTATNNPELARLLKQKSIYEEILNEKQIQLKLIIDTLRDITYQINTMFDLRHDGMSNPSLNNTNAQEK
ncbi:unnamed protein product [Adineta ricciae]|uniref:Mediator of RNA polymerase II transcription subunit 30 n=1 Tax=Adineta ricciae TaxID=249248 RepID=A0A814SQQ8_ADIRI|nr:unnamed protein product [Adineta ricciae]CAF1477215.1 unnamed protein product [Adineta ricciae]